MPTSSLRKFLLGLVGAVVIAMGVQLFTATTATTRFYYSVTPLPLTHAYGINDAGQVVGDADHASLWDNGALTDLGTLGGLFSSASDINNKGQVVGWSYIKNSNNVDHAFMWEKGQMTDLGILPSSYDFSQAYGINGVGQLVGLSGKPGPSSGSDRPRAFLWANGTMTDLSISPSSGSDLFTVAAGINNRGQVVGRSYNNSSNQSSHAVLWDNGTITDLASFGHYSTAYDINDRGQIVGHSDTEVGTTHAFLWQKGKMTDLDSLGSFMSFAYSINNAGQVVGSATSSNSIHAFLWKNGKMTDLNSLLPPNSTWILTEAWDINNRGQIVGNGQFNGQQRAFLLTPTWVTQ